MKLTYVFNGRLPTEKAHGLQIAKMCEAFSDSGVETELIIPFRSNPIKKDVFGYYNVKKIFTIKHLWSIDLMSIKGFPERLAFLIQSLTSGVSIIFYLLSHSFPKNTIFYARDYVSLFILSFLNLNPVAEIHDYRFSKPRSFIRFIINRSKKIITNSEGTLRLLAEHYRTSGDKCTVASNGVDVEFFNIKETREEARRLLNMPLDKTIIGYVGRLETVGKEKGVSILISSIIQLSNLENLILYVVGGPENLVSKYKNQHMNAKNIVFIGQVEYKKIPLYLRAIDIVVIPMPDDRHAKTTSPIKLFEFLAAGKVIIASDLPSIRSYLDDSNAVFFKAGDSGDLTEKIHKIINRPDLMEKLSEKAKTEAKKHSWLNRANKILEYCRFD